jgi:hypothetical protein
MMSFQVETWDQVRAEASVLWADHFQEVGQDPKRMPLNPDLMKCARLASLGMLHIVTARKNGVLVGYHASIIDNLLHYRTTLAAESDLYWLAPPYRNGRNALRLFQEVERSCKARGVEILYDATKVYLDRGELFEHLGYKLIEKRYSKRIA